MMNLLWQKNFDFAGEKIKQSGTWVYNKNIYGLSNFVGGLTDVVAQEDEGGFAQTVGGFVNGVLKSGASMVEGVGSILLEPEETIAGLVKTVINREDVVRNVMDTAYNYVDKNLINGSSVDRANFAGGVAFELIPMLLTGGASKTATVADKVGDLSKTTNKIDNISDMGKLAGVTEDLSSTEKMLSWTDNAAQSGKYTNGLGKTPDPKSSGAKYYDLIDPSGIPNNPANAASKGIISNTRDTLSDAVKNARNNLSNGNNPPSPQLALAGAGDYVDEGANLSKYTTKLDDTPKTKPQNNASKSDMVDTGKTRDAGTGKSPTVEPKNEKITISNSVEEEMLKTVDNDNVTVHNGDSKGTEGSGVNQTQKEIVDGITDPKTQLVHEDNPGYYNLKGNYGEMVTDIDFESNGYSRVSNDRCTDLNAPTKQGIDGVYKNSNPPPEWIINDSKYMSGKKGTGNTTPSLGKTKSGNQLSDKWIIRNINKAVDEDIAKQILKDMKDNPDNVQRVVSKVNEKGEVVHYCVDDTGKVIKHEDGPLKGSPKLWDPKNP